MKPFIKLCSTLLFSIPANAQISDDFSDGNFSASPSWTATAGTFTVNPAFRLQSASTLTNSSFHIVTTNTLVSNCQWEFWCNLRFNTSSTNYCDVFLASDTSNLQSASLNGYFVRLGGTSDEISLYKRSAGTTTKLIDGLDGTLNTSNNTFNIKVTRDAANLWILSREPGGNGSGYITEGSITDNSFNSTGYFGILVRQSTASFVQKHFFDNLYLGPIVLDQTPPALQSVEIQSINSLSLLFDEALESTSSQSIVNYSLSPGTGITAAQLNAANTKEVQLLIPSLVSGTTYTLSVSGVKDLAGNAMAIATATFTYRQPQPHDVVFNELMPDPDPPVGLPNAEYIELRNNSPVAINLKNWQIGTSTTQKKLPAITLLPDSLVVLCGTGNGVNFTAYGIAATEITGLPSLSNAGTLLTLRDSTGLLIHSLAYTDAWYHNDQKSEGGWSLEQIDAQNPCAGQSNWLASASTTGGTPGRRNSVAATFPDQQAPRLLRAALLHPDTLLLTFSEPMDSLSLLNAGNYNIDQGLGLPLAAWPLAPDFKNVKLRMPAPAQAGILYHIAVNAAAHDCCGNTLQPDQVPFALPQAAEKGDVVINEVLFDPLSGGTDFVELYNRSTKFIDLHTLRISELDTLSGQLSDVKILSPDNRLLLPGAYVLLSKDNTLVQAHYNAQNTEAFIDVPDLPAMNADADVVAISTSNGSIIDYLSYSEKMHFPLLASTKGVSLERIDPERPTNDKSNWNSAAKSCGYATPTYRNSQYLTAAGGASLQCEQEIFSPDNDGYQDVLNITYRFDAPGRVMNLFVFDSQGRQMRHLIRNEQLLQEGTLSWNGMTDTNEKAALGIYVLYAEVFDLTGNVNKYKLSCVLAGKL